MQSKFHSVLESIVGVVVSSLFGLLTQLILFPLYGIKVSWSTNIQLVFWFTVISFFYKYGIRRAFNWWHIKQKEKDDGRYSHGETQPQNREVA